MKKVFALWVVLSVFCLHALAIEQDKIVSVMSKKIDNVLMILQDKSALQTKKAEEIFTIMDEVFDYKLMSRISLGKAWKALSREQQLEFAKRFENKLKQSYIDKLELYTDQTVEILEAKQVKSNRIKLLTNVVGKDEVYEINYKFYKSKSGQWYIYDVDIIGVSIIQTYRKQFANFLQSKSFEELLTTL